MVCEHPNNTFTNTQKASINPINEQPPGLELRTTNPRHKFTAPL